MQKFTEKLRTVEAYRYVEGRVPHPCMIKYSPQKIAKNPHLNNGFFVQTEIGPKHVNYGDWIVIYPGGQRLVLTDDVFKDSYQKV